MINIKLLKNNFEYINKLLSKRNFFLNYDFIKNKEDKRKYIQLKLERLKNEVNIFSNNIKINNLNKNNKLNIEKIKKIKNIISKLKNDFFIIKKEINSYYYNIPNIPSLYVPEYININDSLYTYYWGKKRIFNFKIKDYITISKNINGIDFNTSSKISGSKFVIMKNKISLVHRALIQFMLDLHINKHKYDEIYVPLIVKEESLYGTGQLPKFKKNIFYINNKKNNNYCLIPTSEVPLVNMFRNNIFLENNLPVKMVSYTPCFRMENDSYGKNSKGLIKLYQFDKVEMVQFVKPSNSLYSLEEITNHAEEVLKLLNLHYRKRLLSTKEMSFSSCKTYDLEVWFPYEKKYIEVSSCSNTSDFQSRRILSRYKTNNKKIELVHILNASGLAVGRTLAAIIENYQCENIDFNIPNILIPYIKSYL